MRTSDQDLINRRMGECFPGPMLADYAAPVSANDIALVTDDGVAIFAPTKPGEYSLLFGAVPEARGARAADLLRSAIAFMFTQTDAVKLVAHIEKSNEASFTLARYAGGFLKSSTDAEYVWVWPIGGWIRALSDEDAEQVFRTWDDLGMDEKLQRGSGLRL